MDFVEKEFQPYDVVNSDEAWLTTTPYCIASCAKVNNVRIGNGSPGPRLKQMLQAWSQRVGVDIEAQIMKAETECSWNKSSSPCHGCWLRWLVWLRRRKLGAGRHTVECVSCLIAFPCTPAIADSSRADFSRQPRVVREGWDCVRRLGGRFPSAPPSQSLLD